MSKKARFWRRERRKDKQTGRGVKSPSGPCGHGGRAGWYRATLYVRRPRKVFGSPGAKRRAKPHKNPPGVAHRWRYEPSMHRMVRVL